VPEAQKDKLMHRAKHLGSVRLPCPILLPSC
jgi:hypothetical protein